MRETTALFATESNPPALIPRTSKGGARPGNVWILNALHDYMCEGLNPFADRNRRRYARECMRVIRKGQRYLRKGWITFEMCEVSSRHCTLCAPSVEAAPSKVRE